MEKFIVMTSQAKMPISVKARYMNVAVVETDGVNIPKQIHPNHKSVISIPFFSDKNYVGKTENCMYRKELKKAIDICKKLNEG